MENPLDPGSFATRFRSALDHAGLSGADLAARRPDHVRGAGRNSIFRYLRGDEPSPGFVLWAASELGVTHDWLMNGLPPRYPGPEGEGGRRRTEAEAALAISVAINTALREGGLKPDGPAGRAVGGIVLQLVDACSPDELPGHETVAATTRGVLEIIDTPMEFFRLVGGGDPLDRDTYVVTAAAALVHLLPTEPCGVALSDVIGLTKAKVSKGHRVSQVRSGGTIHIAQKAAQHPRDAEPDQVAPDTSEAKSADQTRD